MYALQKKFDCPFIEKEIEHDYLGHWLQQFVATGMVDSSHLVYQEVDAFMTEQLRQPFPITDWQQWPTL